MKDISRRQFIKYGMGGVVALVVGSRMSWLFRNSADAQVVQSLNFTITDAVKEMVTHNQVNLAECYFWIYKEETLPAESPGPHIFVTQGEAIQLSVTNDLDEPHAWAVPDLGFTTGPIQPGDTWTGSFTPAGAGAFLYYDNLNAPVNRMMGLHGALIVVPAAAPQGNNNPTPYENPTAGVQKLFNDFGSTPHFPGLAWHEGDDLTPPFRRYIWVLHQASPKLFAQVGEHTTGLDYPANDFMEAFLRDPFQIHAYHTDNPGGNRIPQYFTTNGQSGHFSHHSPYITPMGRVGEPVIIHIMNAGLWTHSMHMHANHFYITSVNGVVSENPLWVDVYNVEPMDRIDYTVPYMRPPDVPNAGGIGYPDTPQTSVNGNPVWPPIEEFERYHPGEGKDMAQDINGNPIDLAHRQSPLCYPVHDHSEPSQTAQGGNYNCGLMPGIYFVGDRNTPGGMDFPMDEHFDMLLKPHGTHIYGYSGTGEPAPPVVHD